MKRIAMLVLGVVVVSTCALAQAPDAAIETALLAAPANLREGATVIKWKADFTYDTLKKGTNRLVCYDRTGLPEQQPFSVECTSMANLDRVAQNLKFESVGDKVKTQALLDAAEKDGTRVKPEYGSVWYHILGPDREHARAHMTIAVPGATTQSIGLPDNNKQGTVWIMNAGTTTAHLMTPGE
ncbi:MAG TPA: hypothetical protein VK770_10735 [Candidatus Acidoferrum sp.]|jgi:hypothetical protein|nr:hypothetical protein [Candidatus Acidoferrum sp.]